MSWPMSGAIVRCKSRDTILSSFGWNGLARLGMPRTGPSASIAGFQSVAQFAMRTDDEMNVHRERAADLTVERGRGAHGADLLLPRCDLGRDRCTHTHLW
jgi:hypothetical protein